MARTLPKEKLLPSLLDRLTDDDPVNRKLKITNQKISELEKKLTSLKTNASMKDPVAFRQQRDSLRKDLDEQRLSSASLSGAMSSLREIRECVKGILTGY